MDGDQLAHLFCGGCAGIGGGFHRAHIATDHHGHKTAAHLLLAHQLDICGFDHGIGGLNCADEAFCFDHAKRICVHTICSFILDSL